MRQRSLYFVSPRTVELREDTLPEPGSNMVRVRTALSAISPGTELLIYRGEAPRELAADATIAVLSGSLAFPLKYGYACAGIVDALGAGVPNDWLGRRVFAFNPHETHFIATPAALLVIPDDIDLSDAVFLPNMESAVNFVMDAQPVIGDVAAVVGQGVVGLLTTALLARMPLAGLISVERLAMRRAWSTRMGASVTLDPADAAATAALAESADVCIELSGAPAALDTAIALTGYGGRVVIASWYGAKRVSVDLGGRFHRSRMRLIASQVSTLAPALGARWDKSRRMAVAWRMLREVQPSQLITQRLRFDEAALGYHILDQQPDTALQVVFEY
jgi:2-desacetyl-2-hydroxyethyl bacteriochlorophyllide A dehydrogenase